MWQEWLTSGLFGNCLIASFHLVSFCERIYLIFWLKYIPSFLFIKFILFLHIIQKCCSVHKQKCFGGRKVKGNDSRVYFSSVFTDSFPKIIFSLEMFFVFSINNYVLFFASEKYMLWFLDLPLFVYVQLNGLEIHLVRQLQMMVCLIFSLLDGRAIWKSKNVLSKIRYYIDMPHLSNNFLFWF